MKQSRTSLSQTLAKLLISSAVLLLLSGCPWTKTTTGGIAISTLCREWGRSLPSRSRQDTEQTQREVGKAYDVYEAACGESID